MRWKKEEMEKLLPILERIGKALEPLFGKRVLILCSAEGDVALWLGRYIGNGKMVGLELDEGLLELAQKKAKEEGLTRVVEFHKAEKHRIPFPNETFDALVSEFILYPTPKPTEIGQREMARVLRPGGVMILTDVIVTRPVPPDVKEKLRAIGLDYLCEATPTDFRRWMEEAGLVDVEVHDLTPIVRPVWEGRRGYAKELEHTEAYHLLLEDAEFGLGRRIFYIYIQGRKAS